MRTTDGATYIGEIEAVQLATLTLDTDPAGIIDIPWRKIVSMTSTHQYRLEVGGGVRHFGSLVESEKEGHIGLVTAEGTLDIPKEEVFSIMPIEQGFWKKLDGSINFGLTYTQSSDSLQYNTNGSATFRARQTLATLSGYSILNAQDGQPTDDQHNLEFVHVRLFSEGWGFFQMGQVQSNPFQGYDLRSILGGGASKFLIGSAQKVLGLNFGAVYTREEVTDSSSVDSSAEVLVGLVFQRFKRGSHSPSINIGLQTFSTVFDDSRLRLALTASITWKVVGNFSFNVQVNENYDTRPPSADADENDFTLMTGFGYTF